MTKYIPGDRVHHIRDSHCTGIVVMAEHGGAGRYLYTVDWDFMDEYASNPSCWYGEELRPASRFSYETPSPKVNKEKEYHMSQAVWCDQGGHAFSSKDPGKRHFSETRTVDDGFRVSQVTADMDICGPCSESSFLASTPALTSRQDAVPEKGQS
jgi:hypothetical protein